jgi:predicted methyltransferase
MSTHKIRRLTIAGLSLIATMTLSACSSMRMPFTSNAQTATAPLVALSPTDRIAQIVSSPTRSAADKAADARRKPQPMLAFIGARPGMTVLDISSGGGYTTELLARVVGPQGLVYGQSQPRDPNRAMAMPAAPEGGGPAPSSAASMPSAPVRLPTRTAATALAERQAAMKAANVPAAPIVAVEQRFDNPVPAAVAVEKLDVVTLMLNYHDFGFMGVDRAAMNRAVFAALKHGGVYVISDHAGRPGTGISESGTLHRIEEQFLISEVEAAGFQLQSEAAFLRNPADPRDQNTPNPPMPKDDFVVKFVKP